MFGILAFGDSITFGRLVAPGKGWADRLKVYFESKDFYNTFYNLGIPGDSSTGLLGRFEIELRARVQYNYPEDRFIILIAIGTNDSRDSGSPEKMHTTPEAYEKNISKLVSLASKHSKEIVLIGLPPVDESIMPYEGKYYSNEAIAKFNDILKKIAKEKKLLFCDTYGTFIRQKDCRKSFVDGIHPNEKGHDIMYEMIKGFLARNRLIG